jgi:hypothetical protein
MPLDKSQYEDSSVEILFESSLKPPTRDIIIRYWTDNMSIEPCLFYEEDDRLKDRVAVAASFMTDFGNQDQMRMLNLD